MASFDLRRYRAALTSPGAPWFSVAGLVGRFPRGTLSFGLILLIAAQTGSYALAGAVAAMFVVGMAFAGPLWSRRMDGRGQRQVLLLASVTMLVSVAGLLVAVLTGTPVPLWFALSLLAGATTADVGPAVRSRWSALLGPADRQGAFALESIIDETVFVLAPPLLTLIAAATAPSVGVATIAVVGAVGIAWLGLLRRSQPPLLAPRAGKRAVLPPLGILPVTLAWLGMGGMFGAFDVTTVAWAKADGAPWLAGVMMAALALGNTIGALLYGAVHSSASLRRRWLTLGAVLAAGAVALPLSAGGPVVLLVVALFGLLIGPVLVAGIAVVESRADRERVTELLAYPSLGVGAGLPIGSTIAGFGLDAAGPVLGFTVMAACAVSVVLIGGFGELAYARLALGRAAGRAPASAADAGHESDADVRNSGKAPESDTDRADLAGFS